MESEVQTSASPHSTPTPLCPSLSVKSLFLASLLPECHQTSSSTNSASRVHLGFLQAPQHFVRISPALWHPPDHTPGKKKDHGKDMTHNRCRLKQACCGFSRPFGLTRHGTLQSPLRVLVPIKAISTYALPCQTERLRGRNSSESPPPPPQPTAAGCKCGSTWGAWSGGELATGGDGAE